MISLQSLARAVGYSLARKRADQIARQARAEEQAESKKARDERLEQERLDFYTAQLVKQARRA